MEMDSTTIVYIGFGMLLGLVVETYLGIGTKLLGGRQ